MDRVHVAQAPAHAPCLDLLDPFGLFRTLDHARSEDNQQLGADVALLIVAKEIPQHGDVMQPGDPAMDADLLGGDQSAQHDRFAAGRADGGLGQRDVDARLADHGSFHDRDRNSLRLGSQIRLLGVDLHRHGSVGADPRSDAHDQARRLQYDLVGLVVGLEPRRGNPRHELAHLDVGRLVVEGHDLRPAEDVDP